ncbi:probable cytochrome P450 313a4 [Condylostylus longicornis]|uniref:probable cytochrome P450 313a4 n=1 Tax=Condylostylus longicornis TaxID=2530218 RepID=UPI00244DCF18|nr:probable cytochrome P450 313a4 [Condylostylus longicornis]
MNTTSIIFFGIIIFLWLFWLWRRRKYYYMAYSLPGPVGLPIIGSGLNFIDTSKVLYYLMQGTEKYGHLWTGFLGLKPCILTSDPEVIEEIFTNELFVDKMDIYNVINDFLKEGLFTSKYDKWIVARKHINKAFAHKILLDFFPIFNQKGRELSDAFESLAGKGEIDIYGYIHKLQLDTACITTMGQETNFLRGSNPELLSSYEFLIEITSNRIFNPFLTNSFVFKYLYPKKKKFDHCMRVMQKNTLKFIEKKIEDIKRAQEENTKENSSPEDDFNITKSKSIFIDIMVREYLAGNFTWEELQHEVNTMIAAAYETTTNVLYMALLHLAMYPQCQDKLYEEIISVTSEDDTFITYDDVQQLVYTELVMNETMRLISPVPLIGRNAIKDVRLKNNLLIPKDTNIVINLLSLHRRNDIWGPNADRIFNPENFLKENLVNKHPYSFVPFTKGIRNCIGWRYAIFSFKIMLAIIIKRFKVSTTFKYDDLVYKEQIITKFKVNPKISLTLRKNV